MEQFRQLMEAFGREVGLDLSGGVDSPFEVTIDGLSVVLSLEKRLGADELILHARVGTVEPAHELDIYRVLLDANVLWSATEDCTIGVNVDTKDVIIAFRMPLADVTADGLVGIVDAFADNARNWVNFIDATQGPEAGTPAGDHEGVTNFIRV